MSAWDRKEKIYMAINRYVMLASPTQECEANVNSFTISLCWVQ